MTSALARLAVVALLLLPALAPAGSADTTLPLREPVVVNAAAVAQTDAGLVGSIATISISVAEGGSGHIFMDTVPLTQVDMQGSARLAVKVAGAVTGIDTSRFDFFFVVRSNSRVIGGPSAGAIMTVGTIAALEGWQVNRTVMMTGTVNPDGSVGPVGGVPEKAAAAADVGARLFLFPEGQEASALSGRVVDLPSYCRDTLGIACAAVTDVEDAVRYITGHEFPQPPVTGNVTDGRFKAVLGPLAQELLGNATRALSSARANLTEATTLPAAVRETLRESVARAEQSVRDAETGYAEERYYTTASRSFQASIEARYVDLVLDFFEAADAGDHVTAVLDETERHVRAAADLARAAHPTDDTSLQAVGAAQVRASEAESLLRTARGLRENATQLPRASALPVYLEALYNAAFAVERSSTVAWWLRIGDEFGGASDPLDPERLRNAALESIEAAEEAVTYAELVLQEAGTLSPSLPRARQMLESARRDYNDGYHAAATFEALEAEVRGSLALELLGYTEGVPEAKIDRARQKAAEAVARARDRGVEPILAVSYFDFAETLTEPADRLAFYNLARTIARISEFVRGGPLEERQSRFVGDGGIPRGPPLVPAEAAGFLAIGLAVGAGVAAVALLGRGGRPPARVPGAAPPPPAPPPPPPAEAPPPPARAAWEPPAAEADENPWVPPREPAPEPERPPAGP